jgi:hypothetical protein
MFPFILNSDSLTIVEGGRVHTIMSDNPKFDEVISSLTTGNEEEVLEAINDAYKIDKFLGKKCVVKDDSLYYDGLELHGAIIERAKSFIKKDIPVDPLLRFIEKLMMNEDLESVKDLYRFLEHNKLPITSSGNFLAYKKVKNNYRDFHSGMNDNSVGSIVKMNRHNVTKDRNITCSTGLHFASYQYVKNFMRDGRMVVLEINPADVVSIPVDYNNAKGRCCKYKVVGELQKLDRDVLGGKDYISEIKRDGSVVFDFDFEAKNPIEEAINISQSEVLAYMLKDPTKPEFTFDGELGMIVPNIKYCYIDKGKYRVNKKFKGKNYELGRFDNFKAARSVVYELCRAIVDGKKEEFIEEYMKSKDKK